MQSFFKQTMKTVDADMQADLSLHWVYVRE